MKKQQKRSKFEMLLLELYYQGIRDNDKSDNAEYILKAYTKGLSKYDILLEENDDDDCQSEDDILNEILSKS